MSNYIRDFLMLAYSECNTHAREQPKKRDQVILFYTASCYFYLSQLSGPSPSNVMFWALTAAMIILGAVCSYIVFDLRSWTIQYSKAAEVIGRLLVDDKELSSMEDLSSAISTECEKVCMLRETPKFFKRSGNYVSLAFCFITLAPAAAIIDRNSNCIWGIVLTALSAVLYYGIAVHQLMKMVKVADEKNASTWIIRFTNQLPRAGTPAPPSDPVPPQGGGGAALRAAAGGPPYERNLVGK